MHLTQRNLSSIANKTENRTPLYIGGIFDGFYYAQIHCKSDLNCISLSCCFRIINWLIVPFCHFMLKVFRRLCQRVNIFSPRHRQHLQCFFIWVCLNAYSDDVWTLLLNLISRLTFAIRHLHWRTKHGNSNNNDADFSRDALLDCRLLVFVRMCEHKNDNFINYSHNINEHHFREGAPKKRRLSWNDILPVVSRPPSLELFWS